MPVLFINVPRLGLVDYQILCLSLAELRIGIQEILGF